MHPSPATPAAAAIHRAIEDHAFPCVGAKAALARDAVQVVEGGDLRRPDSDAAVLEAIGRFASTHDHDVVFASLVVAYPRTPRLAEAAFEAALWERLQALHALDRDHAWDRTVSSDPADPAFSMSLGGRAFYVVGLHEGASRPARRIAGAALVFNLHSQFEALRADGRYDKLSEAIRARDIALAGSINPMLSRHGEASEARQYSGRQVGDDWRCPFHPMQEGPR